MAIKPDATCPYCRGTGIVTDWVDYGSTRAAMDSECDCVFEDEVDEDRKLKDAGGVTLWYVPGNAPYYYCVYRNGFMLAERATEADALIDFTVARDFPEEV